MVFRRAEKTDIPQLVELRLAFLTENHGPMTEEERALYSEQLADYWGRELGHTAHCYLACDGVRPVAITALLIREKLAGPTAPHGLIGTVVSVYTVPDYRRQGLSTRLMQMLQTDGRAWGLDNLELQATALGAGVYRGVGFVDKNNGYTPMIFRYEE